METPCLSFIPCSTHLFHLVVSKFYNNQPLPKTLSPLMKRKKAKNTKEAVWFLCVSEIAWMSVWGLFMAKPPDTSQPRIRNCSVHTSAIACSTETMPAFPTHRCDIWLEGD
ncbi:uncharacterized protein LOC144615657 [Panthera onca]